MKLYINYISKSIFKPFFICISTLIFLVWSIKVINFFDYIVEYNLNLLTFLHLTITLIPTVIVVIAPLSLSISSVLIYSKFIESKEIIILKNFGQTKWNLIKPLFVLSVFITIFLYFLTLYLIPKFEYQLQILKRDLSKNLSLNLLKEDTFTNIKNNIIFFETKKNNLLQNVIIYQQPIKQNKKYVIMHAKEAKVNSNIIELYDGNFQSYKQEKKIPNILYFKKYVFHFNEFNLNKKILFKAKMIPTNKLLFYFKYEKKYFLDIIFEFHYRFLLPLFSIFIPLFSSAFLLNVSYNRIHTSKMTILPIVLSLIVYLILLFLLHQIKENLYFAYTLYVCISIIIIYSYYLIQEKK